MPIKQNNNNYPWIFHGGAIRLDDLQCQTINVAIRFPYTMNNGKWDLKPLTVNLLKDIGISGNSRVYAVDWGDNSKITISNGMIPYKHEHTYNPGPGQSSDTVRYTIKVYGDDLLLYTGFKKSVGTKPNGFDITASIAKLMGFRAGSFEFKPAFPDNLIKPGARINRAFLGKNLVYGKDVQGTTWSFDIQLTNSGEVRLYNPLIKDNNNWENARTDMVIDWGDGTSSYFYNRKINTGAFNTSSKYIPSHTYNKAHVGDRFTITVSGIEPVLPVGCKVLTIDGTLPEDYYCGNDEGWLSFGINNGWKTELGNIRDTVVTVGPNLLDFWKNVTTMEKQFSHWTKLREIPVGFFKSNIVDTCTNYDSCFSQSWNILKCDPYLLGETNDVVTTVHQMFLGTGVEETIRLKNAAKLVNAAGMYDTTNVRKIRDFLVNVPELTDISLIFSECEIRDDYENTFLQNSPKIEWAMSIFADTPLEIIRFNSTQWSYIERMDNAFMNTNLRVVNNGMFGGDFGKNSAVNSIKMSGIFRGLCSDKHCTWRADVKPLVFKDLGKISAKLYDDQSWLLTDSKLVKVYDGWFDNVFTGEGRFNLRNILKNITTADFFMIGEESIYIPEIFRGCSGILSLEGAFSNVAIGYLNRYLLKDCVNLENIRDLFYQGEFYTHFPEYFFFYNKKISNFIGLFNGAYFKYETNFDFLIWSEVDTVKVFSMLNLANTSNTCVCNRLFGKSSTVKNVDVHIPDNGNAGDLFRQCKNTATLNTILGGRTVTGVAYDVQDTVLEYIVTCITDSNIVLSSKDATSVKYAIDNNSYTTSSTPLNTTVSLKQGTHRVYIKSDKPVYIKTTDNDNFIVTAVFGEYPRGSVIENPGYSMSIREVGRYVFAQCYEVKDIEVFGKSPILHKEVFRYLDKNITLPRTVYGYTPRIFGGEYRNKTITTTAFVIGNQKVIHPLHSENTNTANGDKLTFGNIYGIDNSGKDVNWIFKQYHNTDIYTEFRLSGVTSITLSALAGHTLTFPIKVEVANRGKTKLMEYTINSLNDSIPVTEDCFVRVWTSIPVWINQKTAITELYGVFPKCDFTWKFKDLAPNLRRIGELFFIFCINDSFRQTFKGLTNFEYFPGTLFWYNVDAIDYEECFAECPKLFKVDDYIIIDKKGDINCRGMFKDSGVNYVRNPIATDIAGKVVIQDMFKGCTTPMFYSSRSSLDSAVFKNIDIYGRSGLTFDNSNTELNEYFSCTDLTDETLGKISYVISRKVMNSTDTTIKWNNIFKYASQSIENQELNVKNSTLVGVGTEVTKYLPFVYKRWNDVGRVTTPFAKGTFDYMERLMEFGCVISTCKTKFPYLMLYRNTEIENMDSSYNSSTFANDNIADLLPWNCKALGNFRHIFRYSHGLHIDSGWTLPEHIIHNIGYTFAESSINVPVGFWGRVRQSVFDSSSYDCNTERVFYKNTGTKAETGLYRTFKDSTSGIGTYEESAIETAEGCYDLCINRSGIPSTFKNSKLRVLPKINHLTKLDSIMSAFQGTQITEVPENYINSKVSNCIIDYTFADCPNLFINNKFIDPASTAYYSIDYSLNNVMSGIGDDPEIFGHIKYDSDYEHRSRVIPFDDKIAFIQEIETFKPNVTVKLEGLYNPDLIGFKPSGTFAVLWGDSKTVHTVKNGVAITQQDITHTYTNIGKYEVKILLNNDCCYVSTPESKETDVITTNLPTSFKFGNINDVKKKGLSNMFGTSVKHISKSLFTKLQGVDTITSYPYMFTKFKGLSDLEVGILDCMPNITDLSYFLHDSSRDGVNLILKKGLLDKLTKLQTIIRFSHVSNVSIVEQGLLDKNIELTTVNAMLWQSKVTEVPRDLLHKLTKLTDVSYMLGECRSFVLDDTYNDFFKYNTLVTTVDESFVGCKIKSIPVNIFKSLRDLLSAVTTFGVVEITQWETPDNNMRADLNDINIPTGLFSSNSKLSTIKGLFSGRISIKSYPKDLLNYCKGSLLSVNSMFNKTGIETIHQGTFDGHTTNIDARYMFYDCSVRPCPKVIINSTGTFKTKGMLYGVSGLVTEAELFAGVKTDPSDIQSMYRQGFEYYIMDIESTAGNIYVKALEPSSFPWIGYSLDIDYGDNKPIKVKVDIPDQAKLTEITSRSITAGARTVKVEAPYAIELAGTNITYKRLYGEFGELKSTTHILFKNTSYKNSMLTIDNDNFYKRNSHITSLNSAFADTNIEYIKTNAFKHLSKVTTINNMCNNATKFKIKPGYTPSFDNMRLVEIKQAFEGATSLVVNKDWEPFKNVPTISVATNVFCKTGIITTPHINTTSLTDAQGLYWTCPNLTTTYADILSGASKCWNYYGTFGHCPKLSIIEGETSTNSIGSTAPTITRDIDYKQMFINTGLSQQQIAFIVNNLGGFKRTSGNINTSDMFSGSQGGRIDGPKTPIKIVSNTTGSWNATQMFANTEISEVPVNAITTKGPLTWSSMFRNCYASRAVQTPDNAFSVPGVTTGFSTSELVTLNVFIVSVTPEQVANVMNTMSVSDDNLVDNITTIEPSENSVNIDNKPVLVDNIDEKQTYSVNVSETDTIID